MWRRKGESLRQAMWQRLSFWVWVQPVIRSEDKFRSSDDHREKYFRHVKNGRRFPSSHSMLSSSTLRAALVETGLVNRRAIARILSTLLCCLVISIRPFSAFGGPYAYLVITIKELIFAIQENLAQQLEGTVLNVAGALFAIGVSTLAKYLANLPDVDAVAARSIPAIFLVLIAFVGGWVNPLNVSFP